MEPLLEHRVRGVAVEDGIDAYEQLTGKLAIESLAPKSLIFGRGFRRTRVSRALRRALSLLVSATALVVFAPLLALIALAIRWDSPGPVLFIQDRVGEAGRRFRLFKFRTMRPSGGGTSEWARDNGDRITRLGRLLRKYRLDELPQFFNVVRGDMNRTPWHHGVGPGAIQLREQPGGRDGEDAVRPVLHQAHVALARPPHPVRHGQDRAAGP
ncbi:MAG: hypothetical protein DMF77_19360 [Acidobacteria bacterium]|nr:MAG: hypothetical protein DMF77_19360 [Acidobacteriota bacterium]